MRPYQANGVRGGGVYVALLIVLAASAGFAQPLRATQVLTSNNVIALAGSGDTLWIATERGLNYRTSANVLGEAWPGFEANDLKQRLCGLAFGGGGASALVYNGDDRASDYIGFWHFDHASGAQRERYFRFTFSSDTYDSYIPRPVGGVIYSHGSFWAPFNTGGMVRYDPAANSVFAIRPNDANETPPQNLGIDNASVENENRVLSVSVVKSGTNDLILVTTPAALWTYDPIGKNWETAHTAPTLSSPDEEFVSFDAAFAIPNGNGGNNNAAPTLYSFIYAKVGNSAVSALYRFDEVSNRWSRALDRRERFSVFPAVGGSVYALFEGNAGRLYGSADESEYYLAERMTPDDFRNLLTGASGDPNPRINDIIFLPRASDAGILAVATTTGLYLWEEAKPLSGEYNGFTLARYVREVKGGDAYALPGVIRGEDRYAKSVFVYKLKKDGNVTISVYDYNMSLVKTVVKGERRVSNTPRSTDPARDFWDGTNQAGKRVWPGVYYFKITSTGGDRFLGKIILAK